MCPACGAGYDGPGMKQQASIEVDRPIGDVFAFVTDVTNMPRWVTGARSARLVGGAIGPGTHFVVEYMGGWRSFELEAAVTDYEPPAAFGFTGERGPFSFEAGIRLEDIGEGRTRVTNLSEAGPDSLSTRIASFLFAPILRGSMPRRLLRELERLRVAIEGPATADR